MIGDEHDEKILENTAVLGLGSGRRGGFGGPYQPKCHKNVRNDGAKTTPIATGLAVSGGMGDLICSDGHRCRHRDPGATIQRAQPKFEFDGEPADREFLLATAVF